MQPSTRSDKSSTPVLLWASLATAVLWLVPGIQWVLIPLQYLNTHLHEVSHVLAGLVTGADVHRILVFANGSGLAEMSGGFLPFIGSAGYTGAAILGALMIRFGGTEEGARKVAKVMAALMALALLLWVRGDLVGLLSGFFWLGLFWLGSRRLSQEWLVFAVQFLGLQQALTSLQSVYELVHLSSLGTFHSDARIMEQATGLPAVLWAATWTLVSIVAVVWGLMGSKAAQRRSPSAG
jgi:hypothetical protein